MNFIKKNWKIISIVILGLFLRLYKYDQLFMYGYDQDLAGWVVKDIVIDKHLRLIGQETSTQGIFIGGLFYYLQIPFYLLFKMDPIGVTFLGAILGVIYIAGIYLTLSKIFSKRVALISSLVYAVSFAFIFNDREIVPTQPVIFWSFILFYALAEIIKGKTKKGLLICAVLFSLVWHINFALILPLPLVVVALYLSHKKIKIKEVFLTLMVFVVLSTPLIYFEYRHSFIETKALVTSLTTNQNDIVSGYDKVIRVYRILSKNFYSIFLPVINFLKNEYITVLFVVFYLFLFFKRKEYKNYLLILLFWFLIYFSFFSIYSKRLSEYYLSGIQFIPVILFSLVIDEFFKVKKWRIYAQIVVILFIFISLKRFFTIPINRSYYLERKALVAEIKRDADSRGFPCVAVSYITDPGYELGYRYFFWLYGMHVNHPSSGSPVYTIVFPLNDKLFPVDKTFGALGLIYPDYFRYTKEAVDESCTGENSNLTDPIFGFTK